MAAPLCFVPERPVLVLVQCPEMGSVSRLMPRSWPNLLFAQLFFLYSNKSITKRACKSGLRIAHFVGMDFDKMKALMEASREESTAQGKPKIEEFRSPIPGRIGMRRSKDRIAA